MSWIGLQIFNFHGVLFNTKSLLLFYLENGEIYKFMCTKGRQKLVFMTSDDVTRYLMY